MACSSTSALRVNTVGTSSLTIRAPAMASGSSLTASYAGLTDSPPNGSNPVIRILLSIIKPPVSCWKRRSVRRRSILMDFPFLYTCMHLPASRHGRQQAMSM